MVGAAEKMSERNSFWRKPGHRSFLMENNYMLAVLLTSCCAWDRNTLKIGGRGRGAGIWWMTVVMVSCKTCWHLRKTLWWGSTSIACPTRSQREVSRVSWHYLEPVVRPAAELHLTILVVEGKPGDVDQAGWLENAGRDIRARAGRGDDHVGRVRPVKRLAGAARGGDTQLGCGDHRDHHYVVRGGPALGWFSF